MRILWILVLLLVSRVALADESMIARFVGDRPVKVASFSQYTNAAATAMAIDGKDNFYAAGGGLNVIKYDSKGQKLWQVKLGKAGQTVEALSVDKHGNVFVVANLDLPKIFKLDAKGKTLWQASFAQYRTCNYIAPDQAGACFISGYDKTGSCYVARLDGRGKLKWSRKFQEPTPREGDYEIDDGYTYGYLGVKTGKLYVVFPFQESNGIIEFNPADGTERRRYYGKWPDSNDPYVASDTKGRQYQIWGTGRFAIG